ncbi:CPBP family intramembrane metalloprotease [Paenibacillus sp. 1011MAR3C5]|uniref:CPBP family intramembrane glutamic endopeptidase n=1 Tax=Paenibacillus sp. 1011MAR3C5 TaxID=1675787 RepID=UPI000E6C79E5|nr:type II CAAX endopeptidase family protein [Paenibacillus sp. 1011MAR3C5]RJE88375.1 CPBP family intramembrane metalloprotease [Paenibacillus sp. 1011MAR3C5]
MQTNDHKMAMQFILFTYLMTLLTWGSLILASSLEWFGKDTPLGMTIFILGGNAPPIVAYFILKKHGKVSGFKAFIKTAFALKQPFPMYMLVLILTAAYFGIPALMGGITNDFPIYIAILSIPVMIIGGGLEELGWRHILQPFLETRFSFITSTLLTSCIWALWHLPLFFIPGTSQSNWSFGLFCISIVGMSFALAVIYRISGSIWLCIFFHALINAFSASWVVNEDFWIKLAIALGLTMISLGLFFLYGNKNKAVAI